MSTDASASAAAGDDTTAFPTDPPAIRSSASPDRRDAADSSAAPGLDVRQLARLSDDTGIIQHAIYAVPDPDHGYCVDDNARALITAIRLHRRDPALLDGVAHDRYLQFVVHAFDNATRRFRNFMGFDRRWLEAEGSTDSQARAFWSMAVSAADHFTPNARDIAEDVLERAIGPVSGFDSPRSRAFVLLALEAWLGSRPDAPGAAELFERYADELAELFGRFSEPGWAWYEPIVAYDNARLCEAMLLAGRRLGRPDLTAIGLASLRWLIESQTAEQGHLSIVGNDGWLVPGQPAARFDQQPLEAHALVDACLLAHRVTGHDGWRRLAGWAFDWFHGKNDLEASLIDPHNGGCRDGLAAYGVNRNQGAESVLAYLGAVLGVLEHDDASG